MLIHVVSPGETLYSIAADYRVTTQQIMSANLLPNPNRLVIGQAIIVPVEDEIYTVQSGDTLWLIAKKFGTVPEAIVQANQIVNPSYLYPGTKLVIPQRYKQEIETNGYIYKLGDEAGPVVEAAGGYLTYVSPFAYLIRADGSLQPIDDTAAINAAYNQNAAPMMAITNFTATSIGENLAHVVLSNSDIVEQLLDNIVVIMREKGYLGVNIDFENVLPEDRELYNQFLEVATARMHAEDYFISTALAPKVSEEQTGELYEAHDYEAHGRIVDFVVLMTYEWGWRKGPPQPISPLNEILRVLNYAVTVIPRKKIMLGFQIYARDWLIPFVQGQEAETFSVQEAIRRAATYGTVIQYDYTAESPYYFYTDDNNREHEVWFEDARSAQAKFDAAKIYGLRGISYWALGYPFPQNWTLLEDNFIIHKSIT